MRNALWLGGASLVMAGACAAFYLQTTSCSSESMVDGFTQAEWAQVQTLSPLPPTCPADTTNKYADDPGAAALGQKFFFDRGFGGPIVVADDGTNGGNGKAGELGKVGCINCHQPTLPDGGVSYMIDHRSNPQLTPPNATALGTQDMIRNAGSTLNACYYHVWAERDGVRDSQWSDCETDPEDPTSMNSNRDRLAHIIYAKYKDEYNAVFKDYPLDPDLDVNSANASRFPLDASPINDGALPGGGSLGWNAAWMSMKAADQVIIQRIFGNFGKAIQAYLRLHRSGNAPFDKYVAGDYSQLNASAKNGLHLFIGKGGCIACHKGPDFTDSKFHNTGLAASGQFIATDETGRYDALVPMLQDEFVSTGMFSDDLNSGRISVDSGVPADMMPTPDMIGAWRTPGIRNIAQTAPYMHTGQIATLKEVVHFYTVTQSPDAGPSCVSLGLMDPPPMTVPMHAPCYYGAIDKLIKPLTLTDSDENDLVSFLQTLTGDPLPPNLGMDTSLPNPDGGYPLQGEGGTTDGASGDAPADSASGG